MIEGLKEAYFDEYCKACKNWEKKDHDDPCNDCLSETANMHTHKPVYYEEKEK